MATTPTPTPTPAPAPAPAPVPTTLVGMVVKHDLFQELNMLDNGLAKLKAQQNQDQARIGMQQGLALGMRRAVQLLLDVRLP